MNENDLKNLRIGVLIFTCCVLISLFIPVLFGPSSNDQSLEQLYEDRYIYEKEQQKVQDYIEYQREVGKIKAGYYD